MSSYCASTRSVSLTAKDTSQNGTAQDDNEEEPTRKDDSGAKGKGRGAKDQGNPPEGRKRRKAEEAAGVLGCPQWP